MASQLVQVWNHALTKSEMEDFCNKVLAELNCVKVTLSCFVLYSCIRFVLVQTCQNDILSHSFMLNELVESSANPSKFVMLQHR